MEFIYGIVSDDTEELIRFAENTYLPGSFYINVRQVYDSKSKQKKDRGYANRVISTKFLEFDHPSIRGGIKAINHDGVGLVYIDGIWADICNEKGKVITRVTGKETTDLVKIRKWLYEE